MSAAVPARQLFVADTHLSGERPQLTAHFLRFLAGTARTADTLYILGDLFEAWLGDDLVLPGCQPVLDGLQQLTTAGVSVKLLHGNRDFLIGRQFTDATGVELLPEPSRITLPDRRTALLLHGDTLCIDDIAYQSLRRTLRDPSWINGFLARPPAVRIALAKELREQSREAIGNKSEAIMDVNQEQVMALMEQQQVQVLIHGHTHRPAVHRFKLQRQPAERCVVGDWSDQQGSVLVCDRQGCRLESVE